MTSIPDRLRSGAVGVSDEFGSGYEPLTVELINEAADLIDELAEALEKTLHALELTHCTENRLDYENEAVNMARAAISKAKGKP